MDSSSSRTPGSNRTELPRYLCVGGLGFLTDAGILYVLVVSGFGPYLARAISFPVALALTWFLNRVWTFASDRTAGMLQQIWRYAIVQIVGGLTNYACYAVCIMMIGTSPIYSVFALAIGASFGLLVNFIGTKHLVFGIDSTCSCPERSG